MHTIAKSYSNSLYEFGSFTPNLLQLYVRPACPNHPEGGYQHFLQCLDREGNILSKLSNIGITSLISEGVNVCLYTFAGESSRVVKLILNKIEVSVRSKKHYRIKPGLLVECTNTTHLSCFISLWYKTVLIEISMVMEVAKKVSKSMSMFSGKSSSKNNLINSLLDDPYMIHATTNEKVIALLSIQTSTLQRTRQGWTKQGRVRGESRRF